jgi:hypothetical protein
MAQLIHSCFDQYLSPNDIDELCDLVEEKMNQDIRIDSPEVVEKRMIDCVQQIIAEYSHTANDMILNHRWSEFLCGLYWKKFIRKQIHVIDPLLSYATTKFAHILALVQTIVDLRKKGHMFFCENLENQDTWIDDTALIVRSNGTVSKRRIVKVNLLNVYWTATEEDVPFRIGECIHKSILCAFHDCK